MKIFKNYNDVARLQKRYNNHYNPHRGTETSTSLYQLIQSRRLSDCLELLETLGFAEERAIHVISSVQLIAGLGGVA